MTGILRTLYLILVFCVVFFASTFFLLIAAFFANDQKLSDSSAPVILLGSLIVATSVVVGMAISWRRATGKLDELTAGTRNFIELLEENREFSDVRVPGLHLRNGEFAVRHDRATLAKFIRARVGGGLGTRVRVAGFPIYVGGWKSIPKEELREASTGDLVLTNQRILFLGAQTLTTPFGKLLKCEQMDAGLVISQSEREHPHVLVLENAGLWCFLVNWVSDNKFENRRLPDGMHLTVTGEPPTLQVQVTDSKIRQ
jgi:hypothetical protein